MSQTINQPARESNIQAIVSYFEGGIKPEATSIGVELEHTLIHQDGSPVSYRGEHGVEWVLQQLEGSFDQATRDNSGDLLGLSRPKENITLEPAAQLELSAGPFFDMKAIYEHLSEFEAELDAILNPVGIKAETIGYHPTTSVVYLELIPKRRYEFMNKYLGSISKYGICMMRGSGSTQVSIDYTSVEDALTKMRLASALTPILSLITDNAPVFEGAPRPHPMMRTEIWRYCDPDRCGTVPGLMEPDFTLRDYAEYILDTPAILYPCESDGWCPSNLTFGELYADTPMDVSDVEHALSMFFTDARMKTYVEIRPADALPIPYATAYVALIKGLFYSEENIEQLKRMLSDVTEEDIDAAKSSLMARGYHGTVYGRPVSEYADELISLAAVGLPEDERAYLEPLATLVASRVTLADYNIDDFS